MIDLNGKIVSLPLSGGINSAAVLCWLIESGMKPKELHLYYAHFEEHSPSTLAFVHRQMGEAKRYFDNVICTITYNSVLEFFENAKMIPHPRNSPCSRLLKIEPMVTHNSIHGVQVDLIGFVRTEKRRIDAMNESRGASDMFMTKAFPIEMFDEEWCFEIVRKLIGWYPFIYDIRSIDGKRLFKHNNCLPCKNMTIEQMEAVAYWFPIYMAKAHELSIKLQVYWGRDADAYYTTFGKPDYESDQCEVCKFD